VADAYDAMTSNRPYRAPMSSDAAIEELRKNAGTQFDAAAVEALTALRRSRAGAVAEAGAGEA